jgi:hypothetical protein
MTCDEKRIERIENKIDQILERMGDNCGRNDQRLCDLERERDEAKRGRWKLLTAVVTAVLGGVGGLVASLFR